MGGISTFSVPAKLARTCVAQRWVRQKSLAYFRFYNPTILQNYLLYYYHTGFVAFSPQN